MFTPMAVRVNLMLPQVSADFRAIMASGFITILHRHSQAAAPRLLKKIIYHDVLVPSKFGALAVSVKAGHIAGSLNHNSLAEAKREAVKHCQQGSRNTPCKAITWVRNGCLAAAKGKVKNNLFILADAAGPQGTVEQEALQKCSNRGATECEIIMPEGCSLPQLQ